MDKLLNVRHCRSEHQKLELTWSEVGILQQLNVQNLLRRCFGCLRTGHIARECHSKSRCGKCNGRHHISICMGRSANKEKTNHETQQESSQNQKSTGVESGGSRLNASAAPFSHQNTTSLYVSANKTVLLQTALTTMYNPNQPEVLQKVRAILDLGSQRSYISQRAAKLLRLQFTHNTFIED